MIYSEKEWIVNLRSTEVPNQWHFRAAPAPGVEGEFKHGIVIVKNETEAVQAVAALLSPVSDGEGG